MANDQAVLINKRELVLTNLDKILFPATKTTKQISKHDLITYYQQIANYILPYLKNRPLSLLRFPDGVAGEQFFQKNAPDFFPTWIKRVKVGLKTIDQFDLYPVCNNLETLIYLANYVCVPHIWLSCDDKLDYPNRLIFDLDPIDPHDFESVRLLSLKLRDFLIKLRLNPFALLTGSHGMHVVVPIKRTKKFDEVREFAKSVAQVLVGQSPNLYTIQNRKEKRAGAAVFIDTLRNSFGATSVVPYAVRASCGGPIATPISWEQVQHDLALTSQSYHINNIFALLAEQAATQNPWLNFEKLAVSLTEPMKKLKKYV